MLLCDGCDRGFHAACVGLRALPSAPTWHCSGCAPGAAQGGAKDGSRLRKAAAAHELTDSDDDSDIFVAAPRVVPQVCCADRQASSCLGGCLDGVHLPPSEQSALQLCHARIRIPLCPSPSPSLPPRRPAVLPAPRWPCWRQSASWRRHAVSCAQVGGLGRWGMWVGWHSRRAPPPSPQQPVLSHPLLPPRHHTHPTPTTPRS